MANKVGSSAGLNGQARRSRLGSRRLAPGPNPSAPAPADAGSGGPARCPPPPSRSQSRRCRSGDRGPAIDPVWPKCSTPSERTRCPLTRAEPGQGCGMAVDHGDDAAMRRDVGEQPLDVASARARRRARGARCAAVQPALSRSADVTASRPTSRRSSAIRPTAAIASGATAPV